MTISFLLAFLLPSFAIGAVLIIYTCLFWYRISHPPDVTLPAKQVSEMGLSASELDKLPKVTGKELIMGSECAICLDEIENEQPARLVPGCMHGFHAECANNWLSKHPLCPICRAKLDPQFLHSSENPC